MRFALRRHAAGKRDTFLLLSSSQTWLPSLEIWHACCTQVLLVFFECGFLRKHKVVRLAESVSRIKAVVRFHFRATCGGEVLNPVPCVTLRFPNWSTCSSVYCSSHSRPWVNNNTILTALLQHTEDLILRRLHHLDFLITMHLLSGQIQKDRRTL